MEWCPEEEKTHWGSRHRKILILLSRISSRRVGCITVCIAEMLLGQSVI